MPAIILLNVNHCKCNSTVPHEKAVPAFLSRPRTSAKALDGIEENAAMELCVLGCWPACEQGPGPGEVSVQLKALSLGVAVKLLPSRLGRSTIASNI